MATPAFDMEFMKRTAENYERYFVPSIGARAAEALLSAAGLRSGERVLDAACGTGVVAKLAASRVAPGGAVTGLDPNPGMLAVARETTPPALSIEWHQANAEDLPLPDGHFDVVLCGMGLQFFSDRSAGLREFHRVLATDGRLAASVPGPAPPPIEIMADVLARHVGPETASFVHAVFSLHDPEQLRHLAAESGFDEVDVRSALTPLELPRPAQFLWQYIESTPLSGAVRQIDEEGRTALEHEFVEKCESLARKGGRADAVNLTTMLARKKGAA